MAKPRNQPSKIDQLPPEIQEEIARLRTQNGWTIDRLLEHLRGLGHYDISRSSMGRHVRNLHLTVDKAGERIARASEISKALVERFGDKSDNELARLNIQLLHSQVFDLIMGEDQADADDAGEDGESAAPSKPSALEIVRLSKSIQQLLSAEKMNAERIAQVRKLAREEAQAEAVAAVEAVAKRTERGLTKDTVDLIKREILKVG